MILTVRPATMADAEWVAAHLRPEDQQEVETATGMAAEVAVPDSLGRSDACYSVRLANAQQKPEDKPVMLFGHDRSGGVWLLGTPGILRAPISILREAQHWVAGFAQRGPSPWCVADDRNALHQRWLQLLGFVKRFDVMVNGFPFSYLVRVLHV